MADNAQARTPNVITGAKNYTGAEYLTAKELARTLNTTLAYVYKLTYYRVFPYYKLNGRRNYYKWSDIDEWLRSHTARISSLKELTHQAQTMSNAKNVVL